MRTNTHPFAYFSLTWLPEPRTWSVPGSLGLRQSLNADFPQLPCPLLLPSRVPGLRGQVSVDLSPLWPPLSLLPAMGFRLNTRPVWVNEMNLVSRELLEEDLELAKGCR